MGADAAGAAPRPRGRASRPRSPRPSRARRCRRGPRRWTSRCARSPRPTTRRRCRATSSRHATLEQLLEFLAHRSAYQLKEADPHSWALPRLYGGPKGALVQIQADEYGNGDPERIHAKLFADTMDELGLDTTYGAYIDHLPGATLATVNLMSFFGLHRRWRGAIVGHLALFEMESSVPNRRYAKGLRRLGFGSERATEFFDEHVTADAIHEAIAAVDLAGGLARQQPELDRRHPVGRGGARRDRRALGARGCSAPGKRGAARCGSRCRRRRARRRQPPRPDSAPLGRAEAHELVRAVAERPQPRLAAATQRDRAACRRRSGCRPGPRGGTVLGRAAGRRGSS